MLGDDAHLPQDGIQALQKHVPQVPSCNSWCFSAFSCGAISGSLLCTPPESSQLPPTTSPAGAAAYTRSWNWATGPQSRRWSPSWTPFQREHLGWAPCQPGCTPRWSSSASGAWQTVLIPSAGLSHPWALRTWFHLLNFTVLKWTGQDPEEPPLSCSPFWLLHGPWARVFKPTCGITPSPSWGPQYCYSFTDVIWRGTWGEP